MFKNLTSPYPEYISPWPWWPANYSRYFIYRPEDRQSMNFGTTGVYVGDAWVLNLSTKEKQMSYEEEAKELLKLYEDKVKELKELEAYHIDDMYRYMKNFVKVRDQVNELENKIAEIQDKMEE